MNVVPALAVETTPMCPMILAERAARLDAQAVNASTEALVAHLKLEIEKLRQGSAGDV